MAERLVGLYVRILSILASYDVTHIATDTQEVHRVRDYLGDSHSTHSQIFNEIILEHVKSDDRARVLVGLQIICRQCIST